MGVEDKGTVLKERILGYGDTAVAQGSAATQTNVVPPKPAPAPPAEVISIILIDRRSLVPDGLRKAVKAKLEKDLNAIGVIDKQPDFLKAQSLRFEARWESKAPSAGQQSSFGKWDFPIYFERAHTSDNLSADEVMAVMSAHGIRNSGRAATLFVDAENGWKDKAVEGLGIPPLEGYRKVGFLKVDQIARRAKDLQTGYANVAKHELGHMCNFTKHTSGGLMLSGAPVADDKAGYDSESNRRILAELARLKMNAEAQMQRRYEEKNR